HWRCLEHDPPASRNFSLTARPAPWCSRGMTTLRSMAMAACVLAQLSVGAATIIVPDDNPSVRAAVESAGPGDVVQVRPGTYPEGVRIDASQTGISIEGLGGRPVLHPPVSDGIRID